jgi:parallel beta-helix repeat protein
MGNCGFLLESLADGVTIFGFTITNCSHGIYLNDSWDTNILNNTITGNGIGIGIHDPWSQEHFNINYNMICDNLVGIKVYEPNNADPPKDDRNAGGSKATVWSEGFNSAIPPAGWSLVQYSVPPNPYTWYYETFSPPEGTGFASCQYDPTYTSTQDEWLISPIFSLAGYTNTQLSFQWQSSYYWGYSPYNNYDLEVWVSGDGGSNWNMEWNEDMENPWTNWVWYPKTISLAAYDGLTDVQVALVYYGYDGAQGSFDIVECTADAGTFYDLTVNIVGSGTVTETPVFKGSYPAGTTVELLAIPDVDWLFDHWEDDLTGSNNPEYITMDSN